jgi:hypothetical protein
MGASAKEAMDVRPDLSGRRSVSLNVAGQQPAAVTPGVEFDDESVAGVAATGSTQKKKKKFGTLRRMFRLDD